MRLRFAPRLGDGEHGRAFVHADNNSSFPHYPCGFQRHETGACAQIEHALTRLGRHHLQKGLALRCDVRRRVDGLDAPGRFLIKTGGLTHESFSLIFVMMRMKGAVSSSAPEQVKRLGRLHNPENHLITQRFAQEFLQNGDRNREERPPRFARMGRPALTRIFPEPISLVTSIFAFSVIMEFSMAPAKIFNVFAIAGSHAVNAFYTQLLIPCSRSSSRNSS